MRRPLPLTGAAHDGARLHLRFSGGEQAVAVAAAEVGGAADDPAFWTGLRHLTHPFFASDGPLWRLSLPQTAPTPDLPGRMLWDWGGSQRWLVSDAPADVVRAAAQALGGHAVLFRGAGDGEVFAPLPAPLMALHRRIKAGFDPAGVFNPGRIYAEL
jgi:glycolate oxidase FAD binding subunit